MSSPATTIAHFRTPSVAELASRCEDAHMAMLALMWRVEDEYQRQDGDSIVFDSDEVARWRQDLKESTTTLALAAAALSSLSRRSAT